MLISHVPPTLPPLVTNSLLLPALSLSTIWAILLPNVKRSIYFHREDKTNSEDSDDTIAVTDTKDVASPIPLKKTFTEKGVIAYKFLKKDFLAAYTNLYVVKWSIWWGLGAGCYLQLGIEPRTTRAEVARNISEDSYGLIFGVNTLLTLLVQTLITLVVVSSTGLALGPRQQYMVYGGYFVVLGGVFGIFAIKTLFFKKAKDEVLHDPRKYT
ncbi:unnamed protein product [Timema podura]|uniref:Solute carrier family 40 protein n=1 Tax=Timema podura TaxID=61482 RepID=A0ABN7NML3_TIMPD|nr:unnamed protein product [Timema podura]